MNQYQNFVNDYYRFPPHPQTPQIVSRFVSSIEEAKAVIVDPLSIHIFMDSANGKIYIKRMADNGLSEFFVYRQEEAPQDPYSIIDKRLSQIEQFLGGLNDKSVSNVQSESVSQSTVAEQNQPNGTNKSTDVPKVERNDNWKKR